LRERLERADVGNAFHATAFEHKISELWSHGCSVDGLVGARLGPGRFGAGSRPRSMVDALRLIHPTNA